LSNLKNKPAFDIFQLNLEKFNSIEENESTKGLIFKEKIDNPSKKIELLNNVLNKYHLYSIPMCNVAIACRNRRLFLDDLNSKYFPGFILNTPHECPTERVK